MQYLLEIGLEDMPAHVVTPSLQQFADKTAAFLHDQQLAFDDIQQYATPRRLALLINGLAAQQADRAEDLRGPAKKIAQDADGNWTKAAIGFTRGQGMTVDDIEFKEVKGTEYVFLHKEIAGKQAADILPGLVDVIKGLTFPTRMKWARYDFEFIRPIHWLVSLLDDQVVPMQILDVQAGRTTQGHRFLGHAVELQHAADYVEALRAQQVIVTPAERKAMITDQIKAIAAQHDWQVDPDADLLEEVNNLVEYPTAFAGSFDAKYLAIPEIVLITSMKDNQRYFYARDRGGKMVNAFIGVRNGNAEHIENVIAGNEKVLTARLEDAAFFYQEDQQHTIADYVGRLSNVSFHDKLGSLADKMARVQTIAGVLAQHFGLNAQDATDLQRAAGIYKFDLVTGMVGEFAELQGTMAAHYAQLAGENANVVTALGEQYMPTSAEGPLPTSRVGMLLAMADKLDTLMSFFAVDMIPSGSNDPYALRRQAYGIVRMLATHKQALPLRQLQNELVAQLQAADQLAGRDYSHNIDAVNDFFQDRIKQLLQGEQVSYDIIDAVTATADPDVSAEISAAQVLTTAAQQADFKEHMEALTRVIRITNKNTMSGTVNPDLFENDSERELHAAVSQLADFDGRTTANNFARLTNLAPVINAYFDATMVMAKDEQVRTNRLRELNQLASYINVFGDLTQVQTQRN
ncbi:glycine--tRNA ligase subunit beta [Lacticaseibacillus thailandensis]|uniref:Glycine--tRNA ligase beta subunit n=1 Tax=Lacticaseibacillus thailandensis DSM 22698 = JCM 13996 TaxID=1423810 RepID=A0A0R2CI18_9LACO|nr:glycine--tRNA ligase subunit beta [Lacticaseibacillus thailandensis]KRM88137.1 glycyl-tRNA synthetase subunit beta [Lacticaseibacillus thailandensis DSM 22698 = JCM 13996]